MRRSSTSAGSSEAAAAAPVRRASRSSAADDEMARREKAFTDKLIRQFYREREASQTEPELTKAALLYVPRNIMIVQTVLGEDLNLTPDQERHQGKFVLVREAGDSLGSQVCTALTGDQCTADKTGNRCATTSSWFGFAKCGMTQAYLTSLINTLNEYARAYTADNKPSMPSRFPVRAILLDVASANQVLTYSGIQSIGPMALRLKFSDMIDALIVSFQQKRVTYGDMLAAIYAVHYCRSSQDVRKVVMYLTNMLFDNQTVPLHARILYLNEVLVVPHQQVPSKTPVTRVSSSSRSSLGLSRTQVMGIIMLLILGFAGGADASGAIAEENNNGTVTIWNSGISVVPGLLRQRIDPVSGTFVGERTEVSAEPTKVLFDYFGGVDDEDLQRAIGKDGNAEAGKTELLTLRGRADFYKEKATASCAKGDTPSSCALKIGISYAKEGKEWVDRAFRNLKPGDTIGDAGKGFFSLCAYQNVLNMHPDVHALVLLERIFRDSQKSVPLRRKMLGKFLRSEEVDKSNPAIKKLVEQVVNQTYKGFNLNLDAILSFTEETLRNAVNRAVEEAFRFTNNVFQQAGASSVAEAALQYMRVGTNPDNHVQIAVEKSQRNQVLSGRHGDTVVGNYHTIKDSGVDVNEFIRFSVLSKMTSMTTFDLLIGKPYEERFFVDAMTNAFDKVAAEFHIPEGQERVNLRAYVLDPTKRESTYTYLKDNNNLWALQQAAVAYNTAATGFLFAQPIVQETFTFLGLGLKELIGSVLGVIGVGTFAKKYTSGWTIWNIFRRSEKAKGREVYAGTYKGETCFGLRCSSAGDSIQLFGAGKNTPGLITKVVPATDLRHAHIQTEEGKFPLYFQDSGVITYGKNGESFPAQNIKSKSGMIVGMKAGADAYEK